MDHYALIKSSALIGGHVRKVAVTCVRRIMNESKRIAIFSAVLLY